MEELDLLKKDWQNRDHSLPKLSYDEISKMIWKKSSSIVKWIFYISIFELFIAIFLNLYYLNDKEYWNANNNLNLTTFTIVSNVIAFGIIFYFIWQFYKNYKTISSTDNTKTLMKNILNTRRIVKNYIKISILFGTLTGIVTFVMMMLYDENLRKTISDATNGESTVLIWVLITVLFLIVISAVMLVFWLLYQLFYGILLRKLLHNYKELEKLDL